MSKDIITLIIIRSARKIRTLNMRPGAFIIILVSLVLLLILLAASISGGIYLFKNNVKLNNEITILRNDVAQLRSENVEFEDIKQKLDNDDYTLVEVDKTIPDTTIKLIYSDEILSVYHSDDNRNPHVDQELIEINDLRLFYDRENDSLTVTFRLLNIKMERNISGFVAIITDINRNGEQFYSSFPERVNIDNGEIRNPAEGDYFSITKFKFLNAQINLSPGRLIGLRIYVFLRSGELSLFKPYYIQIK